MGKYTLRAQTDNEGISVDPGAIWVINDNELEFTGNQTNDTKLTMASSGTLTLTGSGTFDAGEKQNGADWVAAGSTLDVKGTLTVRGNNSNVGQFGTVKLGSDTTYIHERNANNTYANDWELGGGIITFSNRFTGNGNITANGTISGNVEQMIIDMAATGRVFQPNLAAAYTATETIIHEGWLRLGEDEAIASSLITLGGVAGKNSRLDLWGHDQTIKGIRNSTGNTREVRNNVAASNSTLTIDVEPDTEYNYAANFNGNATGVINIVKTGLGTQNFTRVGGYNNLKGTLTVNEGIFSMASTTLLSNTGVTVQGATSELTIPGFAMVGPLLVDDGAILELNLALGIGQKATTTTLGPNGMITVNFDYGALSSGNPSFTGLTANTLDGFAPSAADIDINVSGTGFTVGQFPLIQYSATSPLANIDNFNLAGLPAGVAATLVNNTASQSIDLNITEAVQTLTWSGDLTLDGTGDWDIETSLNWDANASDYTDSYVSLGGTGDIATFTDAVADVSGTAAGVNITTTVMPTDVIVNNAAATANYTFSGTGKITGTASLTKNGTGSLTISNTGGNDYTGGTILTRGDIILGVDDALPTDGVVTIGTTGGTSRLLLQGFNQTVGGLDNLGNNTRQILNTTSTGAPTGTLPTQTVNVPALDDFEMGSAVGLNATTDQGNFNVTKSGDGNQALGQLQIGGDLSVTGGTLLVGNITLIASAGDATVNTGGNLVATGLGLDLTSLTMDAGGEAGILWNVSDWTGAGGAGIDWPRLNTSGDFTVTDDASFTVEIVDTAITGFTEANTSFTIGTVGGTMNATDAKFTVDQSGFTAGSGTFDVSVVGSDIILNYTVGGTDAYGTWAAGFPSLTGEFDDDDDLDGLSNSEEWYFFNSNPTVANSSRSPITALTYAGGNSFTFTHLRPVDRTGVDENYEWTTDLGSNWNASGASDGSITVDLTVGAPTPDVAGYESVIVTVTPTGPTTELFGRLRVNQP